MDHSDSSNDIDDEAEQEKTVCAGIDDERSHYVRNVIRGLSLGEHDK